MHKFAEAQAILGDQIKLCQEGIDLDEIQAVEVEEVIQHKLAQAYRLVGKPLLCEDTAFYIEDLNGFPGALIRWYLERLDTDGITRLHGGRRAYAKTVVGYHDGQKMHFFSGHIKGTIPEKPQGKGFGWSTIFIPDIPERSNTSTFAEIPISFKNTISMRSQALRAFVSYLNKTK